MKSKKIRMPLHNTRLRRTKVAMGTALAVCAFSVASGFAAENRTGAAEIAFVVDAPIADAAMRGDITTVRALIAKGADVSAAQGDGMTALHWAAERGDLALAQLLLKSKAKSNAVTRIGSYTPLHIASRKGNADIVKALLASGAAVDATTASGATALHLAAASGDTSAVDALIARKANVNARESEWGQTPLMFAASADRGDAVAVLLRQHADPSLTTKMVDLTDQAKSEQAASKKRNEVMWSFLTKQEQDSISAAAAAAAKAALAGTAAARFPRPSSANPQLPETPTQLLSAGEIQEAIEASREVLQAPVATGAALAADTSDGQVAGFEGTVGMLGGLTALHHAVRQGNVEAAMALIEGRREHQSAHRKRQHHTLAHGDAQRPVRSCHDAREEGGKCEAGEQRGRDAALCGTQYAVVAPLALSSTSVDSESEDNPPRIDGSNHKCWCGRQRSPYEESLVLRLQ